MESVISLLQSRKNTVVTKDECFSWTFRLASLSRRQVKTNPMVGCLVVDKNHKLISWGFYQNFGAKHAEIDALTKIKDKALVAKGTLYVTLEPCSVYGKTPPCVDEVIKWPFAEVFIGTKDVNPKISGRSCERLIEKGFKVSFYDSVWQERLEKLNESFFYSIQQKKSFVALKIASSLDGVVALESGESQWITSKESRELGHRMRLKYDALLVGRATIESDNPQLNIRVKGKTLENQVVILDPTGKLINGLEGLKVFQARKPESLIFILSDSIDKVKKKRLQQLGVKSIELDFLKSGMFNLNQLRSALYKLNINSILVEGGAHTTSSFLELGEFNKLYQFLSPDILGTKYARTWSSNLHINGLKDKKNMVIKKVKKLSKDLFLEIYPK